MNAPQPGVIQSRILKVQSSAKTACPFLSQTPPEVGRGWNRIMARDERPEWRCSGGHAAEMGRTMLC